VRSLEIDLQYEERVTAEIENFLREQLVNRQVRFSENKILFTTTGKSRHPLSSKEFPGNVS
jgi:hypothetical protein